jgi:hypothetical protein
MYRSAMYAVVTFALVADPSGERSDRTSCSTTCTFHISLISTQFRLYVYIQAQGRGEDKLKHWPDLFALALLNSHR